MGDSAELIALAVQRGKIRQMPTAGTCGVHSQGYSLKMLPVSIGPRAPGLIGLMGREPHGKGGGLRTVVHAQLGEHG